MFSLREVLLVKQQKYKIEFTFKSLHDFPVIYFTAFKMCRS